MKKIALKTDNKSLKENTKQPDDEIQADTEPLTEGEKRKTWLLTVITIRVILAFGFLIVRYSLLYKNMKQLSDAFSSTFNAETAKFNARISESNDSLNGTIDYTAKGNIELNNKARRIQMICDLDYGNRVVTLELSADGSKAYFYMESPASTDYICLDTSAIRYIMGDNVDVDWDGLISGLATDDVDMTEYYDTSKIDESIDLLTKQFSSPSKLMQLTSYSKKNGIHVLRIDSYKLLKTLAKCIRPMFKNDESYKNLIQLIEDEKKQLNLQELTVTVKENNGYISRMVINYGDNNQTTETYKLSAVIDLSNIGSNVFDGKSIFDPDSFGQTPETVTFDVAYNRIKRAGLDTKSAFSAAKEALNSFSEKFSYDIKDGTLVVIYDEEGNRFNYVYKDYRLNELEYGDKLYNAWQSGNYLSLNTSQIKLKGYSLSMFEPIKTAADATKDEDYNNAYLSAVQAMQAIINSGYKITESAVFVVTENSQEFQFTYQSNALYDVVSQYYYYVYQSFVKADVSNVQGIPDNVTLYIPSTNDK